LGFEDSAGLATLPCVLLDVLLARLDPAAIHAEGDAAALLLEFALQPTLKRLRTLSASLDPLFGIAKDPEPRGADALGLAILDTEQRTHLLRLDLPRPVALAVASLLDRTVPHRVRFADLPIPLRARRLAVDLPLAELRAVRAGDVILANPPAGGYTLLVAAEHLVRRARHDGGALKIESAAFVARTAGLLVWMMTTDDSEALDAASGLDRLPVRLVFELGRLDVPLAELETIGPGHVFELARSADRPLDIIANGMRIGGARIVTIGDGIGAQVVWIGNTL
jgi:type III secretion protein Q